MRVLVACEFSGTVRDAFRSRGHDAWSVDLLPTEGDPAYHYEGDALAVLRERGPWDLLVAHPPCTYLANSGVHWLYEKPRRRDADGALVRDADRWARMEEAAQFFALLLAADVPRVAVENPIMHGHARERVRLYAARAGLNMADVTVQTVQPWQYGHPESKATQLWLRGLPALLPTDVLARPASGRWANQTPSGQNRLGPSPTRWAERSKTYDGIAQAMAEQWGPYTDMTGAL